MVSPERKGQMPLLHMPLNNVRDLFADLRDEPGLLEDPDGRIARRAELLKLVVPVKRDVPAELLELVDDARLDEADRAGVDARTGLVSKLIVSLGREPSSERDEKSHLTTAARGGGSG